MVSSLVKRCNHTIHRYVIRQCRFSNLFVVLKEGLLQVRILLLMLKRQAGAYKLRTVYKCCQ
jgi:hypothetical protein